MSVTLRCVQEEIADSSTGDVLRLLCDIGEDDSVGYLRACPHKGSLLEVRLAQVGESQEPQDGFR